MGSLVIFRSVPYAPVLPRIYDPDYPLASGMDVDVSDLNGLLVATPVLVQCLDQLKLEAQ